jgi:hypothetical protein
MDAEMISMMREARIRGEDVEAGYRFIWGGTRRNGYPPGEVAYVRIDESGRWLVLERLQIQDRLVGTLYPWVLDLDAPLGLQAALRIVARRRGWFNAWKGSDLDESDFLHLVYGWSSWRLEGGRFHPATGDRLHVHEVTWKDCPPDTYEGRRKAVMRMIIQLRKEDGE